MIEQQHGRNPAPHGKRLSRIILTGFMGAGKSTVGRFLAEALGWRFLDLDCIIEASSQKSVAEIFREHGEPYFREQERQAVEALSSEKRVVLALGGGAVEDEDTLAALLRSRESCLVFLDAPLPELLSRVMDKGTTRPLLERPEELEARHRRRLPRYRAAHITVVTTGLTPQEVAARVLELVREGWLLEEGVTGTYGKLP